MSTLKVNTLTNVAGNADIGNVGKVVQYKYVIAYVAGSIFQ